MSESIIQDSFGKVNHKLDYMVGNREQGQLVQVASMPGETIFASKVALTADISWRLALEGRIYIASDADQNDRVTGQTSFANTTPTFCLHNPSNSDVVCVPFYYQLAQTGTVAGGDIAVETEGRSPSAFSSGTLEGSSNAAFGLTGAPAAKCLLYSTVTATSGYGRAVGSTTLGPDVSPAEGVINIYEWQAPTGLFLWPNASLQVYTSAGTTGPTWSWHFVWAELPKVWLIPGGR